LGVCLVCLSFASPLRAGIMLTVSLSLLECLTLRQGIVSSSDPQPA
jgi:hypothetical protein